MGRMRQSRRWIYWTFSLRFTGGYRCDRSVEGVYGE